MEMIEVDFEEFSVKLYADISTGYSGVFDFNNNDPYYQIDGEIEWDEEKYTDEQNHEITKYINTHYDSICNRLIEEFKIERI